MLTSFSLVCILIITCLLSASCSNNQGGSTFQKVSLDAKPNLIVILADDMGYGDVKAYNKESKIPTPYMDKLVKEGMRFTDAHSPSAVCTPTRYGILTGTYAWRSALKKGVIQGRGRALIKEGQKTLPDYLKDEGYETVCIGKWHLGMNFFINDAEQKARIEAKELVYDIQNKYLDYTKAIERGPNAVGFDYFYGIAASLDMPPYAYIENNLIQGLLTAKQEKVNGFPVYLREGAKHPDFVMEDVLDVLTKKVTQYIYKRSKDSKPFFLYMPLTAPHKPVSPHKRFIGKSKLGLYADFVMQVDWTVGQVVQAVDKNGLAENTIIIVTSDNGSFIYRTKNKKDHSVDSSIDKYHPTTHRPNYILRGTKTDIWEAGHRIPFIVRWKGQIKSGVTTEKTIGLIDIFATMANIFNEDLGKQSKVALDSYSFLPLLINGGDNPNWNRPPSIYHSYHGVFAIRDGDLKLILGNGSGGRAIPKGKPFRKPYHLYNLKEDISENNNLIDKEKRQANTLQKKFDKLYKVKL